MQKKTFLFLKVLLDVIGAVSEEFLLQPQGSIGVALYN